MYAILRIAKHSSVASVGRSGKHKDREQDTPNADPALTPTNETEGAQTSAELLSAVQTRVDLATVKATGTDKPVIAVEYMITASPAFFKDADKVKVDAYFNNAKAWLREKHGADNVVSITRHNDEKTPHLSAFVVPLVEHEASVRKRSVITGKDEHGKPIRETRDYSTPASINLSAKHFFGGAKALSELQTEFHSTVAVRSGLERGLEGSKATHQRVKQFYANISTPDPDPEIPLERAIVKKTVFNTWTEADSTFAYRVADAVTDSMKGTRDRALLASQENQKRKEIERTALDYRKRAEPILAPFRGLSADQARDVLKVAKKYQRDNEDALRQEKERETARVKEAARAAAQKPSVPTPTPTLKHPTPTKGRSSEGRGGR